MIPFTFLPGITESWLILSSHFLTGLKVVSNPGARVKCPNHSAIPVFNLFPGLGRNIFGWDLLVSEDSCEIIYQTKYFFVGRHGSLLEK